MSEEMTFMEDAQTMTFDEIVRLARIAANLGVNKIRLTGGEPLVRRGLPELTRRLWRIEGLDDISLTTNGVGLVKQAQALYDAGLRRINVSLDTLNEARFEQLSRRKALAKVLAGLKAARECGFDPIKINTAAMRGFTEDDILDLVAFARENDYQLRFIEFMPLDANDIWGKNLFLPGKTILDIIAAVYPLERVEADENTKHDAAKRYRFKDDRGEIGVIASVSEPFCEQCNRIRLTADGKLRTCLFALHETDLLAPLRAGASDETLENPIINPVRSKAPGHQIHMKDFVKPSRNMSRIGG
jgi:cyclic pyranopterin phosphate synthase